MRVPELIAQLPPAIREQIAALDLSRRDLSELDGQLILLHGRDDPMIPANQSEALAEALPDDQVELFIVDGLMHVHVQPDLGDAIERLSPALAAKAAPTGEGPQSQTASQRG
jgi:pimeloyl-ACP methyl ester carboxylesterase